MRIRTIIYVVVGLLLMLYLINHRITVINSVVSFLDTSSETEVISPDQTPAVGSWSKSAKSVGNSLEESKQARYKEDSLAVPENKVIDIFPGPEGN